MAQSRGEFKSLEGLQGETLGEACRSRVEAARARLEQGHARDEEAAALLARHARDMDDLVEALFQRAAPGQGARLSLVALGGYGRVELYPFSDLDLLVLCEEDEAAAEGLIKEVIYPLWDAGLKVGHAARTVAQTLELAAEDITVCSALLDARHLQGDPALSEALRDAARQNLFGPRAGGFLDRLRQERESRHRRFGQTVYLLEPNIKSGRGGLRDLATGLWAAKARLDLDDLDQLDAGGGATPRQERALVTAQAFLRRLRLAMHLEAGRQQDQLTFQLQERLAPGLFPEERVPGVRQPAPAVAPAVERLMHAYYRHAQAVALETEGILERLDPDGAGAPGDGCIIGADGEHYDLCGSAVKLKEPERLWQHPWEMLRAFQVALDQGRRLHRATRDLIAEAAAGEPGLRLAADERAAELFLELLVHPEQPRPGGVLEELHDLGVLAAVLPELEPCTGRVQHDLYHVYTVDRHSLYVVALLKAWMRGEQADTYPTAVELMATLERPGSLLMAGLLHDVGKPLGSGHASRGARLARGATARLGMPEGYLEDVTFLVREHLTMAHVSQRRDLDDPDVISAMAEKVGTVDRLRQLYLLTVADTAMTAPGNLSDWKARLLEQLYRATYGHLALGKNLDLLQREALAEQRREKLEGVLRARFGEPGATVTHRLPRSFLLAHQEDSLLHHVGATLELEQEGATVATRVRPGDGGAWELTVCCADAAGLLATLTGVMLAHQIDVLAAQVHTLYPEPGRRGRGEGAVVIDIFQVRAPEHGPEDLWSRFEADLELALAGELDLEGLVRRHTRPASPLLQRVVPPVPTEVVIDNDASDRYTVVEVHAADRIGALHAITRALSDLGLAIQVSRINTEAGRLADIFYVCELSNGDKVEAPARQTEVKERITQALQ